MPFPLPMPPLSLLSLFPLHAGSSYIFLLICALVVAFHSLQKVNLHWYWHWLWNEGSTNPTGLCCERRWLSLTRLSSVQVFPIHIHPPRSTGSDAVLPAKVSGPQFSSNVNMIQCSPKVNKILSSTICSAQNKERNIFSINRFQRLSSGRYFVFHLRDDDEGFSTSFCFFRFLRSSAIRSHSWRSGVSGKSTSQYPGGVGGGACWTR